MSSGTSNVLIHLHLVGQLSAGFASTSSSKTQSLSVSSAISKRLWLDPDTTFGRSTIVAHLSRRIPVEPVTRMCERTTQETGPSSRRRTDGATPCLSFSSFVSLSLPLPLSHSLSLSLSFSLVLGFAGLGGCCTLILTRVCTHIRASYAHTGKRAHTCVFVCMYVTHSLGGYGIAHTERVPGLRRAYVGIVGE